MASSIRDKHRGLVRVASVPEEDASGLLVTSLKEAPASLVRAEAATHFWFADRTAPILSANPFNAGTMNSPKALEMVSFDWLRGEVGLCL